MAFDPRDSLLRIRDEINLILASPEMQNRAEAPICVKEAAHRFGVDERTARRWAEDGSGFKFAGRWMIYESLIAIPKPNVR